jgi:hypothetical protein
MGRAIAAVIVGYIVFAAISFALFTGAYTALGADRAFNPGVYDVSMIWLVIAFAISLVGAIVGGFVCSVLASTGKPPLAMAAIVLLLGVGLAYVHNATAPPDPGARKGDVPNFEAMTKAVMPPWCHYGAPVVGAIGVLIGKKKKRKD